MQAISALNAMPVAPSVRVLLVEDSKLLTERLIEAIDLIAGVHLVAAFRSDVERAALNGLQAWRRNVVGVRTIVP